MRRWRSTVISLSAASALYNAPGCVLDASDEAVCSWKVRGRTKSVVGQFENLPTTKKSRVAEPLRNIAIIRQHALNSNEKEDSFKLEWMALQRKQEADRDRGQ
jgi:hypothetical protein